MKTITEFRGILLQEAFKIRESFLALKRTQERKEPRPPKGGRQGKPQKPLVIPKPRDLTANPVAIDTAAAKTETASDFVSETPSSESNNQTENLETVSLSTEQTLDQSRAETEIPASESQAASDPANASEFQVAEAQTLESIAPQTETENRTETATETATETDGSISSASTSPILTKEEREKQSREEFSKQIAEKYKLDGDKLEHMLQAIDIVDSRRVQDLRKIAVLEISEKEAPPAGAFKRGNYFFVVEYLKSLEKPKHKGQFAGGREGRRGRGGKGGRGGAGGRGDRKKFDKPRGARPKHDPGPPPAIPKPLSQPNS